MTNVVTQHLSVQSILQEWGKGRRVDSAHHIDYPHETPFNRMRRSPGRGTVSAASLDDEQFVLIDRVVSGLSEARRRVLVMYYIDRERDNKIAKAMGMTRQGVTAFRMGAEADVESQIFEQH